MNAVEYQELMVDFITNFHRGLMKSQKKPGVNFRLDDPRGDSEVEKAIRREMFAPQNHQRIAGWTPGVCGFAYSGQRTMSVVDNPDLPASGIVDTLVTPSRSIDLPRLGGQYLSRKFGDDSWVGTYNGLPAWTPLDEDGSVPDDNGIQTGTTPLEVRTGGTDAVTLTRRYRKQVAAAGEGGEADGLETLCTNTPGRRWHVYQSR